MCILSQLSFASGLLGHLFNDDMLVEELERMGDGALPVPTGPGLNTANQLLSGRAKAWGSS